MYSGPGTTTGGVTYPPTIATGADGISRNSMWVSWTSPNDTFVTEGGQIEVMYQLVGATAWTEVGKFHGAVTSCYVQGVSDGLSYNVQVRSINVGGYTSDWVFDGPHVLSATQSIFTTSTFANDLGWTATSLTIINYSTTNSSAGFTWAAQTISFADGSALSVPAGSINYTGLAASTTYYVYLYVNATTGVIAATNSNPPPSTPNQTMASATSTQGRISIPVISFTTLAATNPGTGGGTGGGGNTCPEAAELVDVEGRGIIPVGEVKGGDRIKGHSFTTGADVYRKVIMVRSIESTSWRIVDEHKVSPCEPIWHGGAWIPAYRAAGATIDTTLGRKVFLSVESDAYDEQNYYLTSGTVLLIHNQYVGGIPSPC